MKNRMALSTLFIWGVLTSAAACATEDGPCDPSEPGTICTIAGNGERGFGGDQGLALDASFDVVMDTAVGPNDELWVIDFNNYQVRVIDDQGIIRTEVGIGLLGNSPNTGEPAVPAISALFNHTPDMTFHDGYLYLAAWHNSYVKRVDLSNMMLENFAGIGSRTKYTGDGGPAIEAAVDLPSSVAIDPDGNVVFMDQANQVIRMVDQEGIIHRIAGSCVVDFDVPCAAGEEPVACPGSDKMVCGGLAECDKACTPAYGGDEGHCLDLRMAQPFGQKADPAGRITYDSAGNLIFADTDNNRIRVIDTSGIVTTLAGTGEAGFSGEGTPAIDAQLNHPVDVEVATDGSIYFSDVANSCIRKIEPNGIISTVAGFCSPDPKERGFSGDGGAPTEARLNRPYGIELAGDRMYISDSYNHRVRVVNF